MPAADQTQQHLAGYRVARDSLQCLKRQRMVSNDQVDCFVDRFVDHRRRDRQTSHDSLDRSLSVADQQTDIVPRLGKSQRRDGASSWQRASKVVMQIDCQSWELLWRNHADQSSTVLLRRGFHLAVFAKHFDHGLHDLAAFLDVSHFATTEQHTDLDLVFVLQEFFGLPDFRTNILVAGFGSQSNFFRLRVRMSFVGLFVLVVLVLAVIHDSADGWPLVGGHFDKIQTGVLARSSACFGRENPKLFAVFTDDTNGGDTNVVVDANGVAIFGLSVSTLPMPPITVVSGRRAVQRK